MTSRLPAWISAVKVPALLGAALAITIGAGLADTEAMVENGFAAALQTPVATAIERASAPVAGSEEFWLARSGNGAIPALQIEPVKWTAPVVAGDRIQVSTGGLKRELEVLGVTEVPSDVTRIDTAMTSTRHFIVTCRDALGSDTMVRLMVDGSITPLPSAAQANRAL